MTAILEKASIAVLGAGGHAKVVLSTLQAAGLTVGAVYDDDSSRWGSLLAGVTVIGPIDEIIGSPYRRALIAIGNNDVRSRLAQRLPEVEWITVVHPRAIVHPSVQLGRGTVVFAGAILQPDTSVGNHAILNTAASVDHDCVLEDYVHVAPGAHLAGGVHIEEGAFVGIGSAVIPGRRIGRWATIGAGAVVIEDIAANHVAVGVPARPRKKENS